MISTLMLALPLTLTLTVTGYCPCEICCGKWAKEDLGAGMVRPVPEFTLASRQLPIGTLLRMPSGETMMVQDHGGPIKLGVDRFFLTHEEAKVWGVKQLKVTVVSVPKERMSRFLRVLPLAGQIADAVSTRTALKAGRVEVGPVAKELLKHPPAFEATKVGVGIFGSWACGWVHERGRKNAAKVCAVGMGLLGFIPAAWNWAQK